MTENDKSLLGGLVALAIAASAISCGAKAAGTAGPDRIAEMAFPAACIAAPLCPSARN